MHVLFLVRLNVHHRTQQSDDENVIDTPETRIIVQSLAQAEGGIGLAEAHEQLQQVLGDAYHASSWGKVLDAVHCEPGEEPRMTVDEAFLFYVAGNADARTIRKVQVGFY